MNKNDDSLYTKIPNLSSLSSSTCVNRTILHKFSSFLLCNFSGFFQHICKTYVQVSRDRNRLIVWSNAGTNPPATTLQILIAHVSNKYLLSFSGSSDIWWLVWNGDVNDKVCACITTWSNKVSCERLRAAPAFNRVHVQLRLPHSQRMMTLVDWHWHTFISAKTFKNTVIRHLLLHW